MTERSIDNKWTRQIIKCFRVNKSHLELIERECAMRNIAFSEYIRQSTMMNMRHTRNRSIGT